MSVALVYRGNDPDAAEGVARGIQATGGRAVACHWFGEDTVLQFEGMTESQIEAYLDSEWDRLDALRSAGARL